ncbi:hypothetical protein BBJ28_00019534 [Nothophytophthora sp. Chile5]|nr:hypothetical protein BBJ28_00019534 [Nothophytophthora sp. Chile5]
MRMLAAAPSLKKAPVCIDSQSSKPKEVAPFLRSLRKMLDTESDEILRWTSNGRAFEIHDMTRMMETVLPKYFKHRKYTSFQRQLNYFNFKKWTKSKAVVCTFSNDYFVRDHPELAWRITRKKSVQLGTYKNGGSSASMPRKASMPAKSTCQPQPQQETKVTLTHKAWKTEEIAIRVPRVPGTVMVGAMGINFGSNGCAFPSPTDMDMMLMETDVEPQRYYYHHGQVAPPVQETDSLEWIDNFLPSLEVAPRLEEPTFMGNLPNVGANPLLRQTPHYMFPSLPPPSDFMCMASM